MIPIARAVRTARPVYMYDTAREGILSGGPLKGSGSTYSEGSVHFDKFWPGRRYLASLCGRGRIPYHKEETLHHLQVRSHAQLAAQRPRLIEEFPTPF